MKKSAHYIFFNLEVSEQWIEDSSLALILPVSALRVLGLSLSICFVSVCPFGRFVALVFSELSNMYWLLADRSSSYMLKDFLKQAA